MTTKAVVIAWLSLLTMDGVLDIMRHDIAVQQEDDETMTKDDEIKRKAAMVEKRYGKTTKGTAEKAKPSVKVKPTGSLKKPGIKIDAKW